MSIRTSMLLGLLALPSIAQAICVESIPPRKARDYSVVMLVTLTGAQMRTPVSELRDRRPFRVDYTFEVLEQFKGESSTVTGLYSIELYHDPQKRPWTMAESVKFSPGDSVLVIADTSGELQLSFCGPSKPVEWAGAQLKDLRAGL